MTYFKSISSLEDLKSQYRTLLKKNHPDNGRNLEAMKEINVQFDALFQIWKDRTEKSTGAPVEETADSVHSISTHTPLAGRDGRLLALTGQNLKESEKR